MDDLSRVKRAADAAGNYDKFRDMLRSEERRKHHEGHPPPLASKLDSAVFHVSTCAQSTTAKIGGMVKEPFPPCTCGALRRFRRHNAEYIEAHLDSGGTCSHRNALELRDHWAQAEAELTEALEINERFSSGGAHPAPDCFPHFAFKVPVHTKGCRYLDSSAEFIGPCTCGIHRSQREERHTQIKSHLDEGKIISPPDGYELWTYWEQTEGELTDALEQIEKLSARINNPEEEDVR